MAGLYIGTSGWMYGAWKSSWYAGVRQREWLEFMAEHFNAVEVDGTFYRLQKKETFEKWAGRTPEHFRFAIRGHRFTTHRKRLIDARESIEKQAEPASGLGHKLAAVLWQLPPKFSKNLERLEEFSQALDETWPGPRHVFEARHESWFAQDVADVLSRHSIANCISDAGSFARWDAVTTDFVYVRLHGKPHTYWSGYEREELESWAERAHRWLEEGREVHFYFDNDAQVRAPYDASALKELLAGRGSLRAMEKKEKTEDLREKHPADLEGAAANESAVERTPSGGVQGTGAKRWSGGVGIDNEATTVDHGIAIDGGKLAGNEDDFEGELDTHPKPVPGADPENAVKPPSDRDLRQ